MVTRLDRVLFLWLTLTWQLLLSILSVCVPTRYVGWTVCVIETMFAVFFFWDCVRSPVAFEWLDCAHLPPANVVFHLVHTQLHSLISLVHLYFPEFARQSILSFYYSQAIAWCVTLLLVSIYSPCFWLVFLYITVLVLQSLSCFVYGPQLLFRLVSRLDSLEFNLVL